MKRARTGSGETAGRCQGEAGSSAAGCRSEAVSAARPRYACCMVGWGRGDKLKHKHGTNLCPEDAGHYLVQRGASHASGRSD